MSTAADLGDQGPGVRAPVSSAAREGFERGLLAELTGFAIKLAWLRGHDLLRRGFGEADITPHRFSMLEVISRNPGLRQTRLAAALALSHPATSLAIDFWQERGCVERRKVPGDRRSYGIFTTRQGEQMLEKLRKIVREADAALTVGLSPSELVKLQQLLGKIHG